MATKSRPPAIGVDLGTSYSCVGVFQNGNVEIIPNEHGNRTTPTYVAFSETELLVGEEALNQATRNAPNTVFDILRLIGRGYDDPVVQEGLKNWPFTVINVEGLLKVQVEYKEETKIFTAEEILSFFLNGLKKNAEAFIGQTVRYVVIATPVYFNYFQRQSVREACTKSGLTILRAVGAPTLAAIAFAHNKKVATETNLLIYDLGGGTLDVSVVSIRSGGVIEVKSTAGNSDLGGEYFNMRMVKHLADEFFAKNHVSCTANKRSMQRLRNACEQAKRTLSTCAQARIELDSLFEGVDFYTTITRDSFDELNEDFRSRKLEPVEKVLKESKIDKANINEIVLVGGSTRLPSVQKLLREFFDGRELNRSINPDEAVAYGAAVQAAMLHGDKSEDIQDIVVLNVIPASLGIETSGGAMTHLIRRNTTIPTRQTRTVTTCVDSQTSLLVQIYEGESTQTKDNHLLGMFELAGIPPGPVGVAQIEVTVQVDGGYQVIEVSAAVKGTEGQESKITVSRETGGVRLAATSDNMVAAC